MEVDLRRRLRERPGRQVQQADPPAEAREDAARAVRPEFAT